MGGWHSRALILVAALLCGYPGHAPAYETDQFTNRLEPLPDSTAALDRQVNDALALIVARWRGPRDEARMVDLVYRRLGGLHWVDRIEKWAMHAPEVARLETPRHDSIYSGHSLRATRVTALFGVGATLRVNGVLIGSDKLGHFFSQGRKFYKRWRLSHDEAAAAEQSAFTERALFGQFTTGDYSNADLVANYEGHRFYRSLFEDGIDGDRPAILRWEHGRWAIQRPFTFADHVNEFWDEALNPNDFDRWLKPSMRETFLGFCDQYRVDPAAWTIAPARDAELRARYAHLQLRDTSDLRLPMLCVESGAASAAH
jgi:hypothetical protein